MTENEFHTGELSDDELGEEYMTYWAEKDVSDPNTIVGLTFEPKEGRIYEFQDPDTHEYYELLVDPRDGERVEFETWGEHLLQGELFRELVRLPVPAEWWEENREKYVENVEWSESWKEATPTMDEHLEDLSREAGRQNMERAGGW